MLTSVFSVLAGILTGTLTGVWTNVWSGIFRGANKRLAFYESNSTPLRINFVTDSHKNFYKVRTDFISLDNLNKYWHYDSNSKNATDCKFFHC